MKKFKKQFLAAALVLALGAAVYLNWSVSTPKTVSKTLGESKYVNATVSTTATPDEAESVSTSETTTKREAFFASAKTERDRTQDKIIDKASEILLLDTTSEEERTEAQNQVAAVIKNFTLQDSIETTLKAKGFSDCLCYINEQGCTVTVSKKDIRKNSQVLIKATIKSASNISFDKITIVTI